MNDVEFQLKYLNTIILLKDYRGKIVKANRDIPNGFFYMDKIKVNTYYNRVDGKYWEKNTNIIYDNGLEYYQEEYNDVTKAFIETAKLNKKLRQDPLTNIGNVTALNEKEAEIALSNKKCSIAICDLNDFKKINDTYGHDIGNKVLIKISKIFINNLMSNDLVARVGGDEFVFIFLDTKLVDSLKKLKNITLEIEELERELGIPISVSIGVSYFNGSANYLNKKKEADKALYFGKENKNGTNKIAFLNSKSNTFQLYGELNNEKILKKFKGF